MNRWDADLFERLVAQKYGSIQAFARAVGASTAGVKTWMPTSGPSGDRRTQVAEALGVTVDVLEGAYEPSASPVQSDRIEAKLDRALELLEHPDGSAGRDALAADALGDE